MPKEIVQENGGFCDWGPVVDKTDRRVVCSPTSYMMYRMRGNCAGCNKVKGRPVSTLRLVDDAVLDELMGERETVEKQALRQNLNTRPLIEKWRKY